MIHHPDDEATCERCGHDTTDLTDCEHEQLCENCRTYPGCRFCRTDTRMGVSA